MKQKNLNEDIVWEEIKDNVHDFEKDPVLVGVFVSKEESQFKGYDFLFEVVDRGQVLVRGTTILNDRLEKVTAGTVVKIEYFGEKRTKDGKFSYRDFKVSKAKNI